MRGPGETLVVSCYELGHQPLAAASALGFLRRAGFDPAALDLAVDPFDESRARAARLIAISVPMHTALHIGVRTARLIRQADNRAHVCFYGLYATLNSEYLLDGIADSVIGGEFEAPLVALAEALERDRPPRVDGVATAARPAPPHLERLSFPLPWRAPLPGLERYAALLVGDERRPAAAVETSRGCLHHCRHCPIPPVYGGRFFVIDREIVLEDLRRLARRGIRHVTFADPDFLNGPGHALAVVRAMHEELPELTFDMTTKVEHILRRRALLPELRRCGCLFVVSAVESLSDEVLRRLDKGHTRADVFTALALLRDVGIVLRPSLVAFTPWTTLEDYRDLLEWIERERLIEHLEPVQLSIRLLVPPGSLLAELEAMRPHLRGLDRERFAHRWEHPDPRMDRLHEEVSAIVREDARCERDEHVTFARIDEAARVAAGRGPRSAAFAPRAAGARPPRLTEPWFC